MNRRRLARGGSSAAASTISGDTAGMGDLDDLGQAQRARRVEDRARDGGCAIADRLLELPRHRPTGTRVAEVAGLDEGDAHGPDRVVVGVAVAALDDDLALHPGHVREPIHLADVHPGDAGRNHRSVSPADAPLVT